MILYKYCGFDAGKRIIESNAVGFRQPHFFNDPFELSASYPTEGWDNPVEDLLTKFRNQLKRHVWTTNYALLSLTRSSLNPLMWAHYTKSHQGFVVGMDVNIDAFTSERSSLIPVQFGNVIYTESMPTYDFLSKFKVTISLGTTFHFVPEQLEKLQRVFLYKPMCWSYEEEVRIVKCINGVKEGKATDSGEFRIIEVDGADLFVMNLPKGIIREVYLGARNLLLREEDSLKQFVDTVAKEHPNCKMFACHVGSKAWDLETAPID
jgi:hypothetical protein